MGRKAKNKQAPPKPLPGSIPERKQSNKKRSKSAPSELKAIKAKAAKSARAKRVKPVDRVDEDSDVDEALRPA